MTIEAEKNIDNEKGKKRLSDQTAAKIIAFFLCVMLVAGSAVVFLSGYSKISRETPVGIRISLSDVFTNKSYLESETLRNTVSEQLIDIGDNYQWMKENYRISDQGSGVPGTYDDFVGDLISRLNEEGIQFYIGDMGSCIENVGLAKSGLPGNLELFSRALVNLSYSNGKLSSSINYPEDLFRRNISQSNFSNDLIMYFAIKDSIIKKATQTYDTVIPMYRTTLITVGSILLLTLVLFIWLIVATGRRRSDGTRKSYKWDRVFVEIQLALAALVIMFAGISLNTVLHAYWNRIPIGYGAGANTALAMALIFTTIFIGSSLLLHFLLSIIRMIKSGEFMKRILVIRIIKIFWSGCVSLYSMAHISFSRRNPMSKTMMLMIGALVVTFFAGFFTLAILYTSYYHGARLISFILILVILITLVYFSLRFSSRFAGRYSEIKTGVDKISSGDLSYRIPVKPDATSEFDKLAHEINKIGSAYDIAIRNELKGQRLKADLITGVSHDIKTPLTSIITYVDLLIKEGSKNKKSGEYLSILAEKTERLKKLTEDLFDAAKASSGEMNVNLEEIDLLALVKQEIAELNGTLADIGLDLIIGTDGTSETDAQYLIRADGKLLWRVVDNLFSNIKKYALHDSRVYIDIKPGSTITGIPAVTMEIKNVSAAKLNISADELLERFKRGDESRTTDGSGLGLAIASDLTRLMGGEFSIMIDGDLFKAIVTLPTC